MAQVVDEPAYVAQIAQSIFAKIQGSRDAVSRTGHSIALGCLHRYVGGMGAGQHTQTSVSILLALAQDMSSSIVQVRTITCKTITFPYVARIIVPKIGGLNCGRSCSFREPRPAE